MYKVSWHPGCFDEVYAHGVNNICWSVLSNTNTNTLSNSSTNPNLTHTTECLNRNSPQRNLSLHSRF